jgi:arylformamidase
VPNAPISIFIHGGAWRNGKAEDFSAPAEMMVNAGAHFAVLDFTNVDEAGGDLFPMAEQVRKGVAWVYQNAARLGGDPDQVYIIGHSSGGHLSSCVVITDWEKEFNLPPTVVKGALLCSGMYDLEPVRLSKRSEYVNFTDRMVDDLSAIRHIDRISADLIVAHGTEESPEFQRQARDFAAALEAAGKPCAFLVGEGLNHFEIPETLANPYGLLGRAVLQQMDLGPG